MSGVIKLSDGAAEARVRKLVDGPFVATPTAEVARIAELERRLAEANAAADAVRDDLARTKAEAERAWSEGRTAGLAEGLKAAEDRAEILFKRIGDALDAAQADFHDGVAAFESAAAELAGIALGRIVADPAGRRALVAETVNRATSELFGGSVLAIEVSASDFPDVGAQEALARAIGRDAVVLDSLQPGGCRLRLRLGEVDLSLDGQLARLRAVLGGALEAAG